MQPGAVDELEYAYVSSYDSITNNSLGKLDADVQILKSIYNSTLNQCSVTGIKKQAINNVFTISPNPTNALLNINSGKAINGNVKIEVIDALGKTLISEDYKDFNQSTINVGSLSSGIYFVKISSGDNAITKKFIKE
ncbi:MAG: T9SS type A sorting domain-containing protein [Bacteroidetes bacterium]|nr:T9SS type A sorting domain-containing protein [Bacteroidota bacterium]